MNAIATEARPGSGTAVSLVPPDRDVDAEFGQYDRPADRP